MKFKITHDGKILTVDSKILLRAAVKAMLFEMNVKKLEIEVIDD